MEGRVVISIKWNKPSPQIRIFYIFKTSFYPAFNPVFVDGIGYIFTVGKDVNVVVVGFKFFKSFNYGKQFHPVIGGFTETFRKLLLMITLGLAHKNAVTSFSGVAAARTVGVNF